jgi:hypothetical protein
VHARLAGEAPEQSHGVGLVPGAGNISAIAPLDAAYAGKRSRVNLLKIFPPALRG